MCPEVPEQSGVEQGGDVGAVQELAHLPGVHGQCGAAVGEGQVGSGQAGGEPGGGDGTAAFGPGGVGGEYGGSDGQPMQGEGTAQLG
ncbi:hypothetical protein GCM10020295_21140 [Streptomyces cinereospinus]